MSYLGHIGNYMRNMVAPLKLSPEELAKMGTPYESTLPFSPEEAIEFEEIPQMKMPGGHAGNAVASEEELTRPGTNYLVSKNGNVTYHGKSFAPEEAARGQAHVTVLPGGSFQVNAGELTEAMKRGLQNAIR